MSDELMTVALEALEYHQEQTRPIQRTQDVITAIRAALSTQPAAPSPAVPRIDLTHLYRRSKVYSSIAASPHHMTFSVEALRNLIEEFTAPPAPASRVPLTTDQLFANDDLMALNATHGMQMSDIVKITRVIEAAHGIHPASEGGEG